MKIGWGTKFPSFSYGSYPSVQRRNYGIQNLSYKALVPETLHSCHSQIHAKKKYVMGILPGSIYNELWCLTTLITIHTGTTYHVHWCEELCSVCSRHSCTKLSTLLNASLPCVPFLFAISGAGNNTSVKTWRIRLNDYSYASTEIRMVSLTSLLDK